jgi:hypothetical protein
VSSSEVAAKTAELGGGGSGGGIVEGKGARCFWLLFTPILRTVSRMIRMADL